MENPKSVRNQSATKLRENITRIARSGPVDSGTFILQTYTTTQKKKTQLHLFGRKVIVTKPTSSLSFGQGLTILEKGFGRYC